MVKHNNIIPNVHFHKDWERYVKTWFHQAPQKKQRRERRKEKAARVFPRPVEGLLRPVVTPPTIKYNSKSRYGRGFTFVELRAAGVQREAALGVGISVDHRRRNRSEKSFQQNVKRLQTYKSKLLVFPRNKTKSAKRPRKGPFPDSTKEELSKATQQTGHLLPIRRPSFKAQSRVITEADRAVRAYQTLRTARSDARLIGVRKKRAEDKAANEALTKKPS